mgnify:FL=1
MVRSGMRIVAAVVAVVVVSGCGGDGSSAPKSPLTFGKSSVASPTMVTTSAFPGPSPSSASPQPSETFSPEQQEAADRIIEYFRILDEVYANPDSSVQPLADITTGQSQDVDLKDVDKYRKNGWVQTGTFTVHIKGAEEPTDLDGSRVVQVQVCTDGREADFVDSKTGESIANPTRPRFLLWDMQVVKPATVWLIGDATNEVVGGC